MREWNDLDERNNFRIEGAAIRGHLEGPIEWGRLGMKLGENGVVFSVVELLWDGQMRE